MTKFRDQGYLTENGVIQKTQLSHRAMIGTYEAIWPSALKNEQEKGRWPPPSRIVSRRRETGKIVTEKRRELSNNGILPLQLRARKLELFMDDKKS